MCHMLAERHIVVPLRLLVLCLYKKKKNGSSHAADRVVAAKARNGGKPGHLGGRCSGGGFRFACNDFLQSGIWTIN
jgi:hypothetical protein